MEPGAYAMVVSHKADTGPLLANEVQQWLEWAGCHLLAMGLSSPFPKEPNCAWPEYAQDKHLAYGYTGLRLRPALPNRFEIDLMDKILELPMLVSDIQIRRIINARALVTPVGNRYVNSWTKIAFMLHTSVPRVKRMHDKGLNEIVRKLPEEKVYTIRQTLRPHIT